MEYRGIKSPGASSLVPFLALLLLAVSVDARVERLVAHPLLAQAPDRGCDFVIDARSIGKEQIERIVNDPDNGQSFCFARGVDYRSDEQSGGITPDAIMIRRACTAENPCELRVLGTLLHAARQSDPPVLPAIHMRNAAHWTIRGLTVRPRSGAGGSRKLNFVQESHHITWDQNVIDGSEASGGRGTWSALAIEATRDFYIQRNYIKDAPNPPLMDSVDAAGIKITVSYVPGRGSARGYILDNEIRNWKGVVAASSSAPPSCLDPQSTTFHASVMEDVLVEGNDMYLTDEYIFSCRGGTRARPRDRADECTCVEAAIDSKHRPSAGRQNVYRGNRIHRRRPVPSAVCSSSGMESGASIVNGNGCEGNEVFAGNIIEDTTECIRITGRNVTVVDNLCAEQFASSCPSASSCEGLRSPFGCCTGRGRGCCGGGSLGKGDGIVFVRAADRWRAYRNRLVRIEGRSFEDMGTNGRAQANVVLNPGNAGAGGGQRGAGTSTRENYFYGDGTTAGLAFNLSNCNQGRDGYGTAGSCDDPRAVDHVFATLDEARMEDLTYERHWWSGRETSTIRGASSTGASPHVIGGARSGEAGTRPPVTVCEPVENPPRSLHRFEFFEPACDGELSREPADGERVPPARRPQRPRLLPEGD